MRDVVQDPRDHAAADDQHDDDEGGDLGERERERDRQTSRARARSRGAGVGAAEQPAQRRQQHQRQDHREVLDDQPADGDAAALGLDQAALLQGAQQHDGAGHRERQAEHQAARRPASRAASARPDAEQRSRTAICTMAPGIAMARTDSRSFSEKCRPTPNISRMTPISASSLRQRLVGDEAGRERADRDAGEQIADQRRDAEPMGDRAEDEGEREADDDRGDQRRVMRHPPGGPHWRLRAAIVRLKTEIAPHPRRRSDVGAAVHGCPHSDVHAP